MTKQHDRANEERSEAERQDVTAGKGRRDDVGKPGPGDINEAHGPRNAAVGRSEELKGSERLPRKGNELDKPESDKLGD